MKMALFQWWHHGLLHYEWVNQNVGRGLSKRHQKLDVKIIFLKK